MICIKVSMCSVDKKTGVGACMENDWCLCVLVTFVLIVPDVQAEDET